ncbi:hypothetical protein PZ897_18985 [Hoeflea sp. YIM 152468]|uniref:hypothetical protein n=1 Tax=Hoeflea sp. YIM 152468 TaxID=3031759 RepID=UPI0023DAA648|nr:hypothetical protein [Hoeflea sp. YIM 152468]MDF1610273.1 hypothetical protein [Hoeflea sp. YIM 152468]
MNTNHYVTALKRTPDILHSVLFKDGGHLSIAICRITLFTYLYIHVFSAIEGIGIGTEAYYSRVNTDAYTPKSLLFLLFPNSPPRFEIVAAILFTAKISTISAVIGFFTRLSMITSVLSLIFLASLQFAWEPLWSHPYNSGLIAGIGFMFGRAGDFLSVDRLVRELIFKKPPNTDRPVYYWPVYLGMFGVATVYFGGFYAKWSTPDFTYNFSWVWSDNLRNAMSLPWLIRGQELPWNVAWIVNNPIIWKLGAAAHLATQGLPILAMFSMRKPWIRLLEGSVFAAGVPALLFAMGMWNPEWMLLTVFFIDWDHFLGKRFGYEGYSETTHRAPRLQLLATSAFASAFILVNLVIIVVRYDDRGTSLLYPFSSMNFYSGVRAQRPFSVHQHYPFTYGEVILNYEDGTSTKWFCTPQINSLYLATFRNTNVDNKLQQQYGALRSVVNNVNRRKGPDENAEHYIQDCAGKVRMHGIESIDLYSSILHVPSYPTKIESFEIGSRALVGHYDVDSDTYLVAAGDYAWDTDTKSIAIRVLQQGFAEPDIDMYLANDPWRNDDPGPLIPLPGEWTENKYLLKMEELEAIGEGRFPIVIRVNDPISGDHDFFGGILYR